jgi:oxygen-dependent protoporphyrinogen oxidase
MGHAAVVVGAGAAGLSAALALKERGLEPLLIDAGDRPGGKLGTDSRRGFLLERAAVGLLDRSGELAELCAALRITLRVASPAASLRFVERGGTVYPLPRGPLGAMRTRLLSAQEKLALLGEPFRAPAPEGCSVAEFFARRLGSGGRFVGDAIQTGIHAGDPERLELRTAFPTLHALALAGGGSLVRGALASRGGKRRRGRLTSFGGGMQELVDALARRTMPALKTRLIAVRAGLPRLRLQVESGGVATEVEAERVVLAIPAPAAAQALREAAPELAARLRELGAAPISLVHLSVKPEDVSPLHRGFGLLRPGRAVLGALFPAALWPQRAPEGQVLLSALVGGSRHPEAAASSDDELVRLVRDELHLRGAVEPLGIVRWTEAIPQYELGHGARIAEIERLASELPGLELAGAWYRGVGVLDCLRDGRRAAKSLVK